MSKRKLDISRRDFIGVSIGAVVVAGIGCGSNDSGKQTGSAGQPGSGGASTGAGGATTGTGGTSTAKGGAATGGTSAANTGAATGGTSTGAGGAATGGTSTGAGGAATGGTSTGAGGAATGGTSAANSGAATGGTSTGAGGAATGGKSPATGGAATGGTTSSGTSGTPLVSMVRGTDWVAATQAAIAAVGGLPDLSGKTVMLRVNAIDSNSADTTTPDVIHGVILAVQAASKGTAPTIIVGEDGWAANGNTLGAMQTLGITAVCTATGATAMDLSQKTYTTRTNANAASYPSGVSFSDPVYNADYVIAIPVCKTHSQGGYTMALKLWYGNVPTAGRLHPSAASFNAPPELHLIRKADFTVLDATKAIISGGPQVAAGNTNVAQPKIVVASKDAIAADVTGLWILRYNGSTVIASNAEAWTKFGQITRALKLSSLGWLTASTQFPYVSQGVTEATTIMGY